MTPDINIYLGTSSTPLGQIEKRAISGQIVEHDGEQADELRIIVSNYDGKLRKPRRDEEIRVEVGWTETGVVKAGTFKVTETVKRGPLADFTITAHAADLKKTLKKQKTRSWKAPKTLGDVVNDVAKDNGYAPAISSKLASVKIEKAVYQTNESDMHLLTRLARVYGALFKVADKRLVFVERGAGETASGAAADRLKITPQDCETFSISDKSRPQRAKVKADFYDRTTAKRETIESEAGAAGDLSVPDFTLPQTFGSKEEAQKAVDAKKAELARGEKSFNVTLRQGLVGVAPGGVLATSGFGDDDDQDWPVKRRVFDFGARGLVVQCAAEPKNKGKGK